MQMKSLVCHPTMPESSLQTWNGLVHRTATTRICQEGVTDAWHPHVTSCNERSVFIFVQLALEFHLTNQNANIYLHSVNKSFFFQVNAQVLVSTFCKESQPLIRLAEAIGAVMQSCTTSERPISRVQITTQGKTAAPSPVWTQRPETGDAVRKFCGDELFTPSSGSIVKQALYFYRTRTVVHSAPKVRYYNLSRS